MADYRLGELASASGVSARNIRAYRERGLLDPPRREGRAAFYDDHHLAQLTTINDLLGKGYTSAHIAEFFDTMRQGHDLADILGLQRAIFGDGVPQDDGVAGDGADDERVRVAPSAAHAQQLVDRGLAHRDGGALCWPDARIAAIMSRADDPTEYVRTMLRVSDGTVDLLDDVAAAIVTALQTGLAERWGEQYVPRPEDMAELNRMVRDYRTLANRVVAVHLDTALRRRLVQAMTDYTTDIIVHGGEPPRP